MRRVGGKERLQVIMAGNLASELSGTQVVEFVQRLGRAGITPEIAKRLMGDDAQMAEFVKNGLEKSPYRVIPAVDAYERYAAKVEGRDLITASNLSASERIGRAQTKLKLTHLDEGYKSYDFVRDEGGKTYEVLVWAPGRNVTTREARKHFEALEADGNPALFVDWVTEHSPGGWHVSIPSDDSRLFPRGGSLCAPSFYRDVAFRRLYLGLVYGGWSGDCRFVAFREVKR